MPINPQTLHSDLLEKFEDMEPISYMELKPGDTVARANGDTIAMFTFMSRIGDKATTADGGELYLTGRGVQTYLLNRPKPPLPTEEGARIVVWEIGHEAFPTGIVLTRTCDYKESPWESLEEYHADSDISEWALLPDDFFDELRKDAIK